MCEYYSLSMLYLRNAVSLLLYVMRIQWKLWLNFNASSLNPYGRMRSITIKCNLNNLSNHDNLIKPSQNRQFSKRLKIMTKKLGTEIERPRFSSYFLILLHFHHQFCVCLAVVCVNTGQSGNISSKCKPKRFVSHHQIDLCDYCCWFFFCLSLYFFSLIKYPKLSHLFDVVVQNKWNVVFRLFFFWKLFVVVGWSLLSLFIFMIFILIVLLFKQFKFNFGRWLCAR